MISECADRPLVSHPAFESVGARVQHSIERFDLTRVELFDACCIQNRAFCKTISTTEPVGPKS